MLKSEWVVEFLRMETLVFLGSDVKVVKIWLLLWELNPNFQVPVWRIGVYKIIVSAVDD